MKRLGLATSQPRIWRGCPAIRYGVERAKLRAELDGLIAHLYGLTESEFAHILTTFPIVPDPAEIAAQNADRDAERGLLR